jgi:hypothetical protein
MIDVLTIAALLISVLVIDVRMIDVFIIAVFIIAVFIIAVVIIAVLIIAVCTPSAVFEREISCVCREREKCVLSHSTHTREREHSSQHQQHNTSACTGAAMHRNRA